MDTNLRDMRGRGTLLMPMLMSYAGCQLDNCWKDTNNEVYDAPAAASQRNLKKLPGQQTQLKGIYDWAEIWPFISAECKVEPVPAPAALYPQTMASRTAARNAFFLFRILEESVNRYGTRTRTHALAAADEIALPSVGKCPTHSHTHGP